MSGWLVMSAPTPRSTSSTGAGTPPGALTETAESEPRWTNTDPGHNPQPTSGDGCAERVRALIQAHAAPRTLTAGTTARRLGMSQRTLRRRLTAEGTSFAAVVSHALSARAMRLLAIDNCTIEQTAFALGYADTSAFHRAFKRWTGRTPEAFRRSARSTDPG